MKVDEKFPRIEYGSDGMMKLAMKYHQEFCFQKGTRVQCCCHTVNGVMTSETLILRNQRKEYVFSVSHRGYRLTIDGYVNGMPFSHKVHWFHKTGCPVVLPEDCPYEELDQDIEINKDYMEDLKFIVDLWAKAGRPLDVEMLVNDGVDMFISSFYKNNKGYKRISKPGCHKEV
ncbi:MAG: hypothetical protein IJY09_06355 [Lachnospiraceae bacterium]|nr:hypothetical protein [Lachnospiraceae bacterium]